MYTVAAGRTPLIIGSYEFHGGAWPGKARPGMAGPGMARQGRARQGWAWRGKAGLGRARQGVAWLGMVWQGKARQGWAWRGKAWLHEWKELLMVRTITCTIEGLSPLLMHAYPLVPVEAIEKKTAAEQAEIAAYRIPGSGRLCIPSTAMQRALVGGAGYSKGKGRASLAKPAAACLLVDDVYLDLGTDKYEIDARPVVIPATKGRVVRYRPRLDKWSVKFDLSYDDTLLSAKQVRQIVDDTGKNVGILEFRPEKKGPFGRFVVNSWIVDVSVG